MTAIAFTISIIVIFVAIVKWRKISRNRFETENRALAKRVIEAQKNSGLNETDYSEEAVSERNKRTKSRMENPIDTHVFKDEQKSDTFKSVIKYPPIMSSNRAEDPEMRKRTEELIRVHNLDEIKQKEEREIRISARGETISYNPSEELTDIDGNIYKTVKIGTQIWMAENLRVTKYNDGTAIELGAGAYCGDTPMMNYEAEVDYLPFQMEMQHLPIDEYENEECKFSLCPKGTITGIPGIVWLPKLPAVDINHARYERYDILIKGMGAFYNWFVVDTEKIAPNGWHVPSSQEWCELLEFCGGRDICGRYLKSNSAWDGNNLSGFNALPVGYCFNDGLPMNYQSDDFNSNQNNMGGLTFRHDIVAHFWARDDWGFEGGNICLLDKDDGEFFHHRTKTFGLSIRCIKDTD